MIEGEPLSRDMLPREVWDAPSAVRAAIQAAGSSRHILIADFALRMARLDHVKGISVNVADGPEATEAALRVLVELGVSDPALPEAGIAPGSAIPPLDASEPAPGPAHALGSVREACNKPLRACLTCGKTFRVNFRHARDHRFCSPACRSRHRHRAQGGSKTGTARKHGKKNRREGVPIDMPAHQDSHP
jgi:hypothetical protein